MRRRLKATSSAPRQRLRWVTAVAAIVVAVIVAGCGSSDSSSNGSSSSGGGGSSTSAASSDSKALDMAQATLDAAKPPANIIVTQKSAKPWPRGSQYRIAFVNCGLPVCTIIANAVRSAIDKFDLGWTFKELATDGSPHSTQTAWSTATRMNLDVMLTTGNPKSIYKSQLAELHKQGVKVISGFTLDPEGDGISLVFGGAAEGAHVGDLQAAYVATETAGKANTLAVTLPSFPILAPQVEGFKKAYAKYCPGCELQTMEMPLTALGKDAPDRIVSYVRAHPKVNFIVYIFDGIGTGVTPALKAAGLANRVKEVGGAPSAATIADIKAGGQTATFAQGYYETWAAMINSAALLLTGQKVAKPSQPWVPWWLFTQQSTKADNGFDGPAIPDLYQQYKALWPQS